jgi:hypothetical protein
MVPRATSASSWLALFALLPPPSCRAAAQQPPAPPVAWPPSANVASPVWTPPAVQWGTTPGRLPNSGPSEPAGFGIRAIDCLDTWADGRTYCYSDLPLHSNPVCPGSYNSEIGCFSSANGYTNWTFHGIVIHKGQLGSADSGGVATPTALAANGRVYLYFSQEGGPPEYKPVTDLPNGPRGIGIGRADHPTGPFTRLATPAAAAPAWPKNRSWVHGPHPGGILDDSQVLAYGGKYHLFHSRKLSTDTPGCPVSTAGSNPCCVEWRVSTDAETWVRRGVVLARQPPCEHMACEPMSARVYNGTLVLVTDGGTCGRNGYLVSALASFTGEKLLGRNSNLFASSPFEIDDFSRDRLGTNARKTQLDGVSHSKRICTAWHGAVHLPTDRSTAVDRPLPLPAGAWRARLGVSSDAERWAAKVRGCGDRIWQPRSQRYLQYAAAARKSR